MFDMKLWESLNGLKTIANLIEKHERSTTRKKLVEEPPFTAIKDSHASSSNQIGHQFHNCQLCEFAVCGSNNGCFSFERFQDAFCCYDHARFQEKYFE